MKLIKLMTLATLALGALFTTGSLEKGRLGVDTAQAAGGCGVGFHRGPYGGCRRNVYGAPGYYRGGVAYRGGAVYGRRVYGGRAVYGRRVGVYRGYRGGGRGFHGGGRGFHGGGRFRR